MIFTTKFRVKGGTLHFYAVGNQSLVRRAAESTFVQLDWNAKWNKRGVLVHYPGGWIDRAGSAYMRGASISGSDCYGTDAVTIAHYETNNPIVGLLQTSVYLKVGWLNKKKQEERTNKFYETLQHEFRKLEIPLVPDDEWSPLVAQYPELRASPMWGWGKGGYIEPLAPVL